MPTNDLIKKRKITLAYKIAILIIFLGILYGLVMAFFFNLTIALFPFVASLLSILALALLKKNAFVFSRVLLSINPIVIDALFHAALVKQGDETINSLYISEFGITLIPWVLFDYEEKGPLIFCVIIGFSFLIFQNEINNAIPYLLDNGNPFRNSFLDYATYLTAISVIFICLYFFLGEQNKYEHDNTDLLKELKEKNEEISTQNEELHEAHEQISEINKSLEKQVKKRTEKLEKQNKRLAEYAFINAHILRAPVCRVLGLNYLLKKTDSEEEKALILKHLDKTINEMLYLTRRISVLLTRGGYYDRYDLNYDSQKEAIQESTHQMNKSRKKKKGKKKNSVA